MSGRETSLVARPLQCTVRLELTYFRPQRKLASELFRVVVTLLYLTCAVYGEGVEEGVREGAYRSETDILKEGLLCCLTCSEW